MKATHQWPKTFRRQSRSCRCIIGKAGMKRRREGHPVPHAPCPRAPAQWAFGCDMNDIGYDLVQHSSHPATWRNRQTDLTVAGARNCSEQIGRYQVNLIAPCAKPVNCFVQRSHYAVNLRKPCVADDDDPPHALTTAFGFRVDVLSLRELSFRARSRTRSAQSMIDICPPAASTNAVQLSTQSPSL